jgi:gliding motility-associated-like protein
MSKIFTLQNIDKRQKFIVFLHGLILFSLFILLSAKGYSQSGWHSEMEPAKAFIENQGQFQIHGSTDKVLFAFDGGQTMIYFTQHGISYNFLKSWKKDETEEERERERKNERFTSVEEWKEKEAEEHRMEFERDAVSMIWENTNPALEVIASDPTPDYHSYCIKEKDGTIKNINNIKAFKKILYRNLYPGIDVEYVFHPIDGLKYSLIIHPGADISKVIMKYSRAPQIGDNGDIHIKTKFGDITDHAPASFYADNKSGTIASQFVLNGNIVSFNLDFYNKTKPVIIDPWTQTPSLPNSNGVWECERDGAGNIYIIGGCMPMKLLKYNAAGVLQWTYNTPWDTANNWLGTFVTDLAGNSFVTSGSVAALQKITTTGALVWTANGPLLNTDEYWNIAFNCDQTKLIIGGTTGNMLSLSGAIFDINTSNGTVNSTQIVGYGNMFGFPPIIEEVRSLTSCRNSRYYFMTLDTIGAIDDNFAACTSTPTVFRINHTYNFSYKMENYRPNNGNSGIMSIRANRYFVYTQNGAILQQRSLVDGSVITSVALPGGTNIVDPIFGRTQAGNSGIDIDSCGNVYVGSGNGIYKYDANLNLITSTATPYKIFDVSVSTGGNVAFCGATGTNNNTNRVGTIQSANMGACPPMTLFCCNTNICPVNPICDTMPAFNLIASQAGGIWSGAGIIDAALGTFDPATAGAGIHTIVYTLPCGSDSIQISVLHCGAPCPTLTFNITTTPACIGTSSGSVTVTATNGSSPYVFAFEDGTGANIATYVNVVGSQSVYGLASGQYILIVLDAGGCVGSDTITIGTSSSLMPVITGPDTICSGNTATIDAGVYATYLWSTGDATQTIQITAAGTYSVTVTDAGGCSGSASISVVQGNNLTPSITGTLSICPGTSTTLDAGSGYSHYNWSNSASTQTISVNTGGTYLVTVTDAGGCSGSALATVTIIQTLPVTATAQPLSICPGNNVTLTATGGQTYVWNTSPTNTNAIVVVNPVTTTTYVVTATYNGCTTSASVTVIVDSVLSVNAFTTNASCGHDDGTAWVDVAGTGYTYLWNSIPPQLTQTATGLAAGVYSVTVNYNGCIGIATAIVLKDPGPLAGFYTKPDYPIVDEGPVNFIDQSVGSIMNWQWNFGDSTFANGSNVTHEYADTGSYVVVLIVTDMEGCKDTAWGIVHIHPQFAFWIPNSFTPNDDDRNEFFMPVGVGIDTRNYLMYIYDRWGREMFHTEDINEGWNGTYQNKFDYKKAVQGTYVYLISVKDLNGKSYTYKGIVILVQ